MKNFITQSGNIGDDIDSLHDTYKCITNVGSFKNVNHEMNSEQWTHIEYLPCVRQMLIFIFCLG